MVQYTFSYPSSLRVFDGEGNELFDCVYVDTGTQQVERLKVDADGNFIVTPDGKRVVRETIFVPGVRVELKEQ